LRGFNGEAEPRLTSGGEAATLPTKKTFCAKLTTPSATHYFRGKATDAIYMGENQGCLLGYTLKGESIKCQITVRDAGDASRTGTRFTEP
jgi:hypothetical protein